MILSKERNHEFSRLMFWSWNCRVERWGRGLNKRSSPSHWFLKVVFRIWSDNKVSSESLSIKFGIMSVNQLATYHYLMETYNIINHGSSEKLQVKLMPKSAHSKSLRVPLVKKTSCRGFGYYAARLWNKLPAKIRISAMNVKSNQKSRLLSFQKCIKDWILGDPVKGIKGGVPFQ